MQPFFLRLIVDRINGKATGIQRMDQRADLRAFSGGAISFKNDHHGDLPLPAFPLKSSKLRFQLFHPFLILFFLHFLCEIYFLQHPFFLLLHLQVSRS